MTSSVRCPICRRAASWTDNPHRPFCSERCQLVDLGNWVTERYRLPSAPVSGDDPETDEPGDDRAP